MTIIKFDSIVEVSFVIQTLNECSTKRGRHNISNGTRTLSSHTDHPQWRFHVYPPFPLSPPLYTINFIDQMQLPVCYCVYIVKLHAVRDPPPFSAQKCIFFICVAVCSFFLLFRASLGKCIEMPTCHEVLRVRAACVFVCVCVWSLAVSAGGLNRQAALALSEAPAPCLLEILYLLAWVSPKPLSPRRAPFASVHLNLSHRFDTASLGVHSEMTCI